MHRALAHTGVSSNDDSRSSSFATVRTSLERLVASVVVIFLSWGGISSNSLAQEGAAGISAPKWSLSDVKTIEVPACDMANPLSLRGRDAARQWVVLGNLADGQVRDVTRLVTFQAEPTGIVHIDSNGYMTGLQEGEATVKIRASESIGVDVKVVVTNLINDLPINFANQITPIFTKYGCNSGGCHGKAGGQNGFKLSLLGFEPADDYEWIVKEARGRRVFPASPDHSLLLLKSAGAVPHGGGGRIPSDTPPYRVMRRWIEQGLPYGSKDDPVVVGIETHPSNSRLAAGESQQLVVLARFSDGRAEDVTRMATFESNDPEMAEASVTGLVTLGKLPGTVAVMARFQGMVSVYRATVPLGASIESLPPEKNLIDQHIFAQLKSLGLPPSQVADDAVFLRRVTIDMVGRLPRIEEVEAFLADTSADKREKLVDRLLDSGDYASAFATKWAAILRNKRESNEDRWRTFAFYRWLHDKIAANEPMDQVVRELLTATGSPDSNPAVGWYRELKEPEALVEDTAQLFLGLRIGCAKCHHHPQEKWSQQDYYGMAAFFTRIGRKADSRAAVTRVVHQVGQAQATHPRTGQAVMPAGLGTEPMKIDAWDDPRTHLANWLTDPSNPFFAKAIVNRYWKHFYGRGLVEPEDDMRETNPASNPELLQALATDFSQNGYDVKRLVRMICNSSTYQLSSEPNAHNLDDKINHSRYYPKRLAAEVTLDAVDQITGQSTQFGGLPLGTLATELPDNGFPSYFLTVFGRPEGNSACECERSNASNLAQCLHLINSDEVQRKLKADNGLIATLSKKEATELDASIRIMYLRAFSRPPSADELQVARQYIESKGDRRVAIEDLAWVLMNTKEFLFNH